jgi:hypothetical protein
LTANLIKSPRGFYVDADYQNLLSQVGLDSIETVFGFQQGENLSKSNLAPWRQRIRLQLPNGEFAYLKRYVNSPKFIQLRAWFQHGRRAFLSRFDQGPVQPLQRVNVNIPRTLAYGGQWGGLFEQRSFILTLELPGAESLERKLPLCFSSDSSESQKKRKAFIQQLADFIRRFHDTGFRHRDLYLSHIFYSDEGVLSLIDLHRCFRPKILKQRYLVKDLAELHYSCDGHVLSRADRIRFYRAYQKINKLTPADKVSIARIHDKALQIARHDRRHGRNVPFESNRVKGSN